MMQRAESFVVLRRKPVKVSVRRYLFDLPSPDHHSGIRHIVPNHQQPYRYHAEAQDCRLHRTVSSFGIHASTTAMY